MFTGFGFDVVEDLTYASNEALTSLDSDISGAGTQLVLRTITAFPAHWSCTALVAVGVLFLLPWFANPEGWSDRRRVLYGLGLIAAGPVIHFIWNSPPPPSPAGMLLAMLLKILVNLTIFLLLARWIIRTEKRWCAARVDEFRGDFPPAVLESVAGRKRRSDRHARRELLDRIQRAG